MILFNFHLIYSAGHQLLGHWNFTGACRLNELHLLLSRTLLIRRLKRDVLQQLPPKRRERIRLQIPAGTKRKIRDLLGRLKEERRRRAPGSAAAAAAARGTTSNSSKGLFMELYLNSGLAKVAQVWDHLSYLLGSGRKCLVFAHHSAVIDQLSSKLDQAGRSHIVIDGRTPARDRQHRVDRFQSSPDCVCAVLSITAAGQGLTLTAADLVLFAELYWVPGALVQCEDRAHRIGQTAAGGVQVQYLVADDTIDTFMWDTIRTKLEVVGCALNGIGDALNAQDADAQQTAAGGSGSAADSSDTSAMASYEMDILDLIENRIEAMDAREEKWDRRRKRRQAASREAVQTAAQAAGLLDQPAVGTTAGVATVTRGVTGNDDDDLDFAPPISRADAAAAAAAAAGTSPTERPMIAVPTALVSDEEDSEEYAKRRRLRLQQTGGPRPEDRFVFQGNPTTSDSLW